MDRLIANAFRDTRSTALTLGVGTVIATHTLMFILPDEWQDGAKKSHALTNLLASGAIVWGARMLE